MNLVRLALARLRIGAIGFENFYPGKSGEVICARSRSSNSDICNGPWSSVGAPGDPEASAAICGALRQVEPCRFQLFCNARRGDHAAGERFIACRNPTLAAERARKREAAL